MILHLYYAACSISIFQITTCLIWKEFTANKLLAQVSSKCDSLAQRMNFGELRKLRKLIMPFPLLRVYNTAANHHNAWKGASLKSHFLDIFVYIFIRFGHRQQQQQIGPPFRPSLPNVSRSRQRHRNFISIKASIKLLSASFWENFRQITTIMTNA